jgi:Lrp/AsnC family transcriptional regulator of ectoine degradation
MPSRPQAEARRGREPRAVEGKAVRARLDAIDIRILAILQREGRITKLALAERAGLSPTPCWERLKRLERTGLIAGYHARIELRRLAPHAIVFAEVTLRSHRQVDFAAFEAEIRALPEVVECWAVGGGLDYLLKIVTPDIDAYQRLIDRLLGAGIGIDRYFTYVVTKPVKHSSELPIAELVNSARGREGGER